MDCIIKNVETENELKTKPLNSYGFTEDSVKHLRKKKYISILLKLKKRE